MVNPSELHPAVFVVDVDGVMTTGQFAYTAEGKAFKVFGPDDHDALLLLKEYLPIHFVSGDRKGFEITRKRISDDMKFPVDLVSTVDRVGWMSARWPLKDIIYMGDGIMDPVVFEAVGYSICPSNGFFTARKKASHVTQHAGGDRAVAEACVYILDKFFGITDLAALQRGLKGGEWGANAG